MGSRYTQASFNVKPLSGDCFNILLNYFILSLKCSYWLTHFLHWALQLVFGTLFSQNPIFSILFTQETEVIDFCEGACHYHVTEFIHWGSWYYIKFVIICYHDWSSRSNLNFGTKMHNIWGWYSDKVDNQLAMISSSLTHCLFCVILQVPNILTVLLIRIKSMIV